MTTLDQLVELLLLRRRETLPHLIQIPIWRWQRQGGREETMVEARWGRGDNGRDKVGRGDNGRGKVGERQW